MMIPFTNKLAKIKGIPKRGDSRIAIPTVPSRKLLKDLRGLDKPQLFDENDADLSLFVLFEDDSIFLRHMMTWWIRVETSVTVT